MPASREVLEALKRDELLSALDAQGLEVEDRRRRDGLIDALLTAERESELEFLLEERDEFLAEHVFWVPPRARWEYLEFLLSRAHRL